MINYKISVIVPVFNAAKYLEKCLNTLVNQTYKNIEIIAVNDASTDNSLNILYEYSKKYSFFKVINLLENHRQGGARNIGIQNSTGEFISFVDSDDWIELFTYEKFINILQHDDYDLICCSKYYREFHNDKTKIIKEADNNFLDKISCHLLTNKEREQLLFKGPGVCQNLYKASLLKENKIFFPEKVSYEDNFFVPLVFAYVKKVGHFEQPFYHYRKNMNSTLFRSDTTQLDRLKVENLRYNEFCARGLLSELYDGYELLSLKLYYLITLGTIYKFFKQDFLNKSKQLKEEFYEKFPNFKKNPYYKIETTFFDRLKISSMEISPRLLLWLFYLKDLKD